MNSIVFMITIFDLYSSTFTEKWVILWCISTKLAIIGGMLAIIMKKH